jgi:phosphohistidine phosphatase SixA
LLVILFRHGPAGRSDPKRWPDDRDRPLTTDGEKRTRQAAEGLARLLRDEELARVVVWTSPLVRADQTAHRVATALGGGKEVEPQVVTGLAPGGSMRGLLERLTALAQEAKADDLAVVLVGHEPDLGQLAGELALDPPGPLPLKKAGACAVAFDGAPRRRAGTLEWFLPPRLLRALGRGRKHKAGLARREVS